MIKKIFFYTGTVMLDPDRMRYSCPVHSSKVIPLSKVEEGCEGKCGKELTYLWHCPKPAHEESIFFEEGFCKKECGESRIVVRFCRNANHRRHYSDEMGKKCPEQDCKNTMSLRKWICRKHPAVLEQKSGKCTIPCNEPLVKKYADKRCPVHYEESTDGGETCAKGCGERFNTIDSKDFFGYVRNVDTFMTHVGAELDGGRGWEFCVNSEGEKDFRILGKGVRPFKYYHAANNWAPRDKVKYKYEEYQGMVQAYLGKSLSPGGKETFGLETAALVKDPEKAEDLGWEQKLTIKSKLLSNCSSRCAREQLNQLEEWLGGSVDWTDSVFAVCDCNSFHNSAYLFGRLALKRRVEISGEIREKVQAFFKEFLLRKSLPNVVNTSVEPAVLILNLDQHTDVGALNDEVVASDRWGLNLLGNFNYGAYVVFGPSAGMIAYTRKGGGSADQAATDSVKPEDAELSSEKLQAKFDKVWDQLAERIAPARFEYYYLTIDRDCMKNSFTQWGDQHSQFKDAKQVRQFVDAMALSLKKKGVVLTGMDVTGLPEITRIPGHEGVFLGKGSMDMSKIMKNLGEEISELYKKFSDWL